MRSRYVLHAFLNARFTHMAHFPVCVTLAEFVPFVYAKNEIKCHLVHFKMRILGKPLQTRKY